MVITPRMMKQEQAAMYLGCSVNTFKTRYKPHLKAYDNFYEKRGDIPIWAFDKNDLDDLIEKIKSGSIDLFKEKYKNGSRDKRPNGGKLWVASSQDSQTEMESGISTSSIAEKQFAARVTQLKGKMRKQC
ncbi:hypothetical protein [Pasteurella multocida]|uniref:hypothetical protein n=1 Tax=Pasteurella multocida TaxID=747 RepID=UPI001E61CDB5|nr:hypothetical protein [Pasteurella multocida]MDC4236230.1 hypothetical protein [Pasteurella multocida]